MICQINWSLYFVWRHKKCTQDTIKENSVWTNQLSPAGKWLFSKLKKKKQCIICKYLDKFERIIEGTVERSRWAEHAWLSFVYMACVNES